MAETDPGRLFDTYAHAKRLTQERLAQLFAYCATEHARTPTCGRWRTT